MTFTKTEEKSLWKESLKLGGGPQHPDWPPEEDNLENHGYTDKKLKEVDRSCSPPTLKGAKRVRRWMNESGQNLDTPFMKRENIQKYVQTETLHLKNKNKTNNMARRKYFLGLFNSVC